MAQKVLPPSLRLHKSKQWQDQDLLSTHNYVYLLSIRNELRIYLNRFFYKRKIVITNLRFQFYNPLIKIFLYLSMKSRCKYTRMRSFYRTFVLKTEIERNLNGILAPKFTVRLSILRLNLTFLKRKRRDQRFVKNLLGFIRKTRLKTYIHQPTWKRVFPFFSLAVLTKNPNLMCFCVYRALRKKKKGHKKLFYLIYHFLTFMLRNTMQYINQLAGFQLQFFGRINGRRRSQSVTETNGKLPFSTLSKNFYTNQHVIQIPAGSCNIKLSLFFQETELPPSKLTTYLSILNALDYNHVEFPLYQQTVKSELVNYEARLQKSIIRHTVKSKHKRVARLAATRGNLLCKPRYGKFRFVHRRRRSPRTTVRLKRPPSRSNRVPSRWNSTPPQRVVPNRFRRPPQQPTVILRQVNTTAWLRPVRRRARLIVRFRRTHARQQRVRFGLRRAMRSYRIRRRPWIRIRRSLRRALKARRIRSATFRTQKTPTFAIRNLFTRPRRTKVPRPPMLNKKCYSRKK